MLDYFDPRILTGVLTNRPPQYSLFTDLFFTKKSPQPVETFELHVKNRERRMLPFVRNEDAARILEPYSGEVVAVRAPRIRVKRRYKAEDILKNPLGYDPYDLVSNPVEQAIVEDLDDLRRDLDQTLEWMCAKIITTGVIEIADYIEGQKKVIYKVDNRMPATHRITVGTSDAKWSNSKSKLMEQVEEWSNMIQETTGSAPTELILGKNVWGNFFRHSDVKDNLDNRRIELGEIIPRVCTMFKGVWNGLRIWTYIGTAPLADGSVEYLLDPDSIVLGYKDPETVIEYGRPVDHDCPGATAFFAKTYKEEDPSVRWVLAETRPLPWVRRSGAFVCAKVL